MVVNALCKYVICNIKILMPLIIIILVTMLLPLPIKYNISDNILINTTIMIIISDTKSRYIRSHTSYFVANNIIGTRLILVINLNNHYK